MTKQQFVYESLREEILNGLLAPGERLLLTDLAARFGVSPIPVREALRLLEHEDLIEVLPHVRVAVKALPFEEALWAMELRLELEPVAVRDALPGLGAQELGRLQLALASMAATALPAQADEFLCAYNDFHDTLFASVRNRRLSRMISELRATSRRFRAVQGDTLLARGSEADLASLLEALEAGEAEAAAGRMRAHRQRTLDYLRGWCERRPEGAPARPSALMEAPASLSS